MATIRGTPNSPNTSSIGTSRDYSTIADWEVDTDNDLETAEAGEIGEIYADSTWVVNSLSINGATCNSLYYRLLRSASGEHQYGIPSTDGTAYVLLNTTSAGSGIIVGELRSRVYDYTHTGTITGAGGGESILRMNSQYTIAVGILVRDWTSDNYVHGIRMGDTGGNYPTVYLSMMHGGAWGYHLRMDAGSAYNCTVVANTNVGVQVPSGKTATVVNVISVDNSAAEFEEGGTWSSSDYNLSTDDTAPGGNSKTATSGDNDPTFVSEAGDDFHLQSGSDGAGVGSDLSGTFTTDIDEDTITSWPIGFDQPEAAAAATNSGWAGAGVW